MSLKDRLKKNAPTPLENVIKSKDEGPSSFIENWENQEARLDVVREFLALHCQDLSKTVFKFCVDKKYLINIILPPTSLSGVVFRSRKIVYKKLEEIVEDKSDLIKILRAIESKSNIIITGDAGKTTLLDAILAKITSKVVTLEESPQLQAEGDNFIKLLKTVDIKEFALSKLEAQTLAIDDCTPQELEYVSQLKSNYIAVFQDLPAFSRIRQDGDFVINIENYKISIC